MDVWQGTIVAAVPGEAIGSLEEIAATLTALFPDLKFEWSGTGADRLADADARGIELPDLVRRVMTAMSSKYTAIVETDSTVPSFNLGATDPATCIWAQIEGGATFVESSLHLLQSQPGWMLEGPGPLESRAVGPGDDIQLSGKPTLFHEIPPETNATKRKRP